MKGAKQVWKYITLDGIVIRFFYDKTFKYYLYTINNFHGGDERYLKIKKTAVGICNILLEYKKM